MGRKPRPAWALPGWALGALLPLLLPGTAHADPPGVYALTTTAVGIAVQSAQRPSASVVTAGLVDSTAAYATSSLSSSGTAETLAAAYYPGDLVATGPALLCGSFLPCPTAPPAYPLVADASYPTQPSATAPVGSGTSAGTATATAGQTSTAGRAQAVGASGRTPVPVAVEAGVATTRAWVDAQGAHVRSRSTLHGITAGALAVAALEATETVDVHPDGSVHDQPRVVLSGVTFAGRAASVDATGVHLVGQDAGLPDRTLAQQGLRVRLVGADRQDLPGAARSAAGGLQLTFSAPVTGVPAAVPGVPTLDRTYLGSVTLGGAGAAVAASSPGGLALPALPAAPAGSSAGLLAASGVPPSAGPGRSALDGGTPTPSGAPAPAPPAVAAPPTPTAAVGLPDLRTLTLVLAVLPLALLALWRTATHLRWRSP